MLFRLIMNKELGSERHSYVSFMHFAFSDREYYLKLYLTINYA